MGHYASEMGYGEKEAEEAAERKKIKRCQRIAILQQMIQGPGFGECDGNLTLLEKEVATHLRKAYEFLCLLDRVP
jgi:hypothetical protein